MSVVAEHSLKKNYDMFKWLGESLSLQMKDEECNELTTYTRSMPVLKMVHLT